MSGRPFGPGANPATGDPELRIPDDLLAYLESGSTRAPVDVVVDTRAAVASTRQRGWRPWNAFRPGRANTSRRALALVVTVAIVVGSVGAIAPSLLSNLRGFGTSPSPTANPRTGQPVSLPPARAVRVVREIRVPAGTHGLAAGNGILWVTTTDGVAHALDAGTGAEGRSIAGVGTSETVPYVDGDRVWLLDPNTGGVPTELGPQPIASIVDPATGAHVELEVRLSDSTIAVRDGRAWMSGAESSPAGGGPLGLPGFRLLRIDGATRQLDSVPLVPRVVGLDAVAGRVWGVAQDGSLVWIDPDTMSFDQSPIVTEVARIFPEDPNSVASDGGLVVAEPDGVWVAAHGGSVVHRVDPATLLPVGSFQLPTGMPIDGLLDIGGTPWILTGSRLLRIDSSANQIAEVLELGETPSVATADGSGLWILVGDRARLIEP